MIEKLERALYYLTNPKTTVTRVRVHPKTSFEMRLEASQAYFSGPAFRGVPVEVDDSVPPGVMRIEIDVE